LFSGLRGRTLVRGIFTLVPSLATGIATTPDKLVE
jgi:hypothetical protein